VSVEGKIIPSEDYPGMDAPVTGRLSRRHLLMGGALLAVSGLAFARTPVRRYPDLKNKQFEALFPHSFGQWRTNTVSELVLPPESKLADKLYQHLLTRTYVNDEGVGVMFLAAYNSEQLNNVQLHRPEICYYASGFSIDKSSPFNISADRNEIIPARAITATMGSRIEQILYWTRIGEDFPQSWAQQRLSMTKANLAGYMADGLLLRVSVINPDQEQALRQMSGFLGELMAHTGKGTRQLLIGQA
jgi:EpsI family protein